MLLGRDVFMGTFDFRIRQVRPADLDAVTAVEAAGFPPAEAAGRETFAQRIARFPECFLVAETDRVIGIVNGSVTDGETITDDLFEAGGAHRPGGAYQAVFGLAVLPDCRRYGVAAALLGTFCDRARAAGRKGVILTCKEQLISYYMKQGFQELGVSASVHGGAVWYDMIMRF